MPQESLLLTLAQIAIALAGFAALLITYRRGSNPLSQAEVAGQKLIIELSLMTLFLALIPVALFWTFESQAHLWRASSVIYIAAFLIWNRAMARRINTHNLTTRSGDTIRDLLVWGSALAVLLLQFANAILLDAPWAYLWGVIYLLTAPANQFLQFITAYLEGSAAQEDDSADE